MDPEKTIKDLIETVIREGGSDIHISEGRKPAIRVVGNISKLEKHSELSREDITEVLKILVGEEKANKFFKEQELDFSYSYEKGKARLRGNAFFHFDKVAVALRLIPKIKTLEELNLPSKLAEFARKRQGFFLAVGPVGQGKTTTLAAMIDLINRERTENIITIEDPIEYLHKDNRSIINQREVGVDTQSFETALWSTFREDVNVIMVGEMRTPETMSTAVTAAETGHLVLSTLHTNNASQTIDRIIDSFPPVQQNQIRAQLANTLLGIFSQRLIPSKGGGRVPAYELLLNNKAVANLIREGRTHEIDTIIETSSELGMISMNRSLLELIRAEQITLDEARRHSLNPAALERLL